ncbi:MAG: hypothetical protein R8M45_05395 [Ghiorsea sp.]
MRKKFKCIRIALTLALGVSSIFGLSHAAQAGSDVSLFADAGVFSQYLARSVPQGIGDVSVQGDVGIEHASGISASVWFATGQGGMGTDTEYDFTLDYSGETHDLGYSVGYYTIGTVDTTATEGGEFYAALSYGVAATAVYVATDYTYYEASVEYAIADVVDTSVLVGYEDAAKLVDVTLNVSKDFEMSSYTLTPSVMVGKLENADAEFVIGVNASF